MQGIGFNPLQSQPGAALLSFASLLKPLTQIGIAADCRGLKCALLKWSISYKTLNGKARAVFCVLCSRPPGSMMGTTHLATEGKCVMV